VTKNVAVLPGDGIGREVVPEAVRLLECFEAGLEFEHFDVNAERYLATGEAMPEEVFVQVEAADAVFLGAIGDPRIRDPRYQAQVLRHLRVTFDLYANVRPARLLDDSLSPLRREDRRAIDLIVLRENTEGLYSRRGSRSNVGTEQEVAIVEHYNTYAGVTRIIDHAFQVARREVCMVDKWNAMPESGALWHERFRAVAASHPEVGARHLMVDAAAAHLVRDPGQFDVIVTENCFGDILSDLAGELAGGIGMSPSANLNPLGRHAVFEPVHGSAPDIAGQGLANPIAAIRTGGMILQHFGLAAEADALERAVVAALKAGERTRDLGGVLSTREAAAAVARHLASPG
jgi:3-isopropylmalate dehydrogenase